jgi:hypothetical protein
MRRGVMTAAAMRLCQTRFCGLAMMQRVRSVQRRRAGIAHAEGDKNQSKCPNARQLHPVNILSTLKFVPYVCPWAAHFLLIGLCADSF